MPLAELFRIGREFVVDPAPGMGFPARLEDLPVPSAGARGGQRFEYQMAMPMSVANQLIADLLFNEEPLFGGTGSYMEKQKERGKAGEIQIEDVRADTEKRVKNGEISYRPTLLGGCSKVGRCDSFMLGDYTECTSCDGAIIQRKKLVAAIEDAQDELSNYSEDSGEYQIVKAEIDRLVAFKVRLIDSVEV